MFYRDTRQGRQGCRIRPGRTGDGEALRHAFERFSEESRYFRFFTPTPRLSQATEAALTAVDDHKQYAWGVFDPSRPSEVGDESGLAIAAARLYIDADDPSTAEATLAVVDEYHGRGLGSLLMELLISTAAVLELDSVIFDVLADNRPMRGVLKKLGDPVQNGEPVFELQHNARGVEAARRRLDRAVQVEGSGEADASPVNTAPPESASLVIERIY